MSPARVTTTDPRAAVRGGGILQLGWKHYWLLVGTLGALLGSLALILFLAHPR